MQLRSLTQNACIEIFLRTSILFTDETMCDHSRVRSTRISIPLVSRGYRDVIEVPENRHYACNACK
jgi:hypothetical protein